MMSNYRACDEALKTALETLGIPVEREKNSMANGDFITYAPALSTERVSGDDTNVIAEHTFIINAFTRQNVTALVRKVRCAIINAGFYNFTVRAEVYEDETKLYRTPMTVQYFEDVTDDYNG